jgi:RNA recognition motif-containing protein
MSEKKLRVSNLPFEMTENDIGGIFKNYNVELITIPQINRKRSSSHFNDGIAIVMLAKTEEVHRAISEVNGKTIGSRKIQATKTETKQHLQHLHDFDNGRTVGVTNVDKTIGNEQLKMYFENKQFPVSKVEIFPQHDAALVEFKDISSSGQVTMLEPHELNNKVLRIVLKQDVMTIISGNSIEKPREKMIPPNLLRRRRR